MSRAGTIEGGRMDPPLPSRTDRSPVPGGRVPPRHEASADGLDVAARWEALVVGAGPAGAATAYALARAGLRVLLLDRQRFPRGKVCGGCLSARSIDTLRALGLESRVLDLPGIPLSRVEVHHRGRVRLTAALPGGRSLTRATLDRVLVDAAVEAGAVFVSGVQARVLPAVDGTPTRGVRLKSLSGRPARVEAGVVVAADGLGHPSLAGMDEFRSRVARRSWVGVGALLSGLDDRYMPGTVSLGVGEAGYAGLVRVEDGLLNVAAALDPRRIGARGGIGAGVGKILAEAGLPAPAGLLEAPWLATPHLTRKSRRVVGHRLLVVGDSAAYVEPFTGEGIAWALSDAARAAEWVKFGLDRWDPAIERAWASARGSLVNPRFVSRAVRRLLRSGTACSLGFGLCRWFPSSASLMVRATCAPLAEGRRR